MKEFVKAVIQIWKQSSQVSYLDTDFEIVPNQSQFPRSMLGSRKWSIIITDAETGLGLFKLHFMKLPEQSQTLRLIKVGTHGRFGFADQPIVAGTFQGLFLSTQPEVFASASMFFIVWTCPSTMLSIYAPGTDYSSNAPAQFEIQSQNSQMLMTAGVYTNILSPVFATTGMILHTDTGKMTKGNRYNKEFTLGGLTHVNRVLQTNDAVCITIVIRQTPSTTLTYPLTDPDIFPNGVPWEGVIGCNYVTAT